MKKLFLALVLVAIASISSAQYSPGGGGGSGSLSYPLLAPLNTDSGATATYSFDDDPTKGMLSRNFASSVDDWPLYIQSGAYATEDSMFMRFDKGYPEMSMVLYGEGAGLNNRSSMFMRGSGSTAQNNSVFNVALWNHQFDAVDFSISTLQLFGDASDGEANMTLSLRQGGSTTTYGWKWVDDTYSVPGAIRWGDDTDYTDVVAATPSGANTITFPVATGTVALAPTKVTLASNQTSSDTSPGVTTAILFTPASSTNYLIQGMMYVATDTAANGEGYGQTWPTADTLTGSCRWQGATSNTAHVWRHQEAASAGTDFDSYSASPGVNERRIIQVDCVMFVGANASGNFTIRTGQENAGAVTTLYAGSWIEYSTF